MPEETGKGAAKLGEIFTAPEELTILAGVVPEESVLASAIADGLSGRHAAAAEGFAMALAQSAQLSDQALGEVCFLFCRSLAALGEQNAAAALAEFEAARPLAFPAFVRQSAFLFQQIGRAAEAKPLYARVVRRNPLDMAAVLNLGLLMIHEGDGDGLKALLEAYEAAGGDEPKIGVLAARVSLCFPSLGVLERLIARMVKRHPDDAELWHASFTILANAHVPGSAVSSAKRAAELDQARRFMCFRRHLPFSV